MKKTIQLLSLLLFFLGAKAETGTDPTTTCNNSEVKVKALSALSPYYYASSKISTISYSEQSATKEVEVPLFKGEKYKLVFDRSELPKNIEIEIYDKPSDDSKRKLLYSSKSLDSAVKVFTYEPIRAKNLYVNYIVPATESTNESGCFVFVLGYQLTFTR